MNQNVSPEVLQRAVTIVVRELGEFIDSGTVPPIGILTRWRDGLRGAGACANCSTQSAELDFEHWYATNAVKESAPLGSLNYAVARKAWHAAIDTLHATAVRDRPPVIYPVPPQSDTCPILDIGPWMLADAKPEREGMYLRAFDTGDAFSWWREGKWFTAEVFGHRSDIQETMWRGAVLRDGKTHEDWVEAYGASGSRQSHPR